jgi:hypothetical protein
LLLEVSVTVTPSIVRVLHALSESAHPGLRSWRVIERWHGRAGPATLGGQVSVCGVNLAVVSPTTNTWSAGMSTVSMNSLALNSPMT